MYGSASVVTAWAELAPNVVVDVLSRAKLWSWSSINLIEENPEIYKSEKITNQTAEVDTEEMGIVANRLDLSMSGRSTIIK